MSDEARLTAIRKRLYDRLAFYRDRCAGVEDREAYLLDGIEEDAANDLDEALGTLAEVVASHARAVEGQVEQLSARDSEKFLEALENPPEPNDALKKLMAARPHEQEQASELQEFIERDTMSNKMTIQRLEAELVHAKEHALTIDKKFAASSQQVEDLQTKLTEAFDSEVTSYHEALNRIKSLEAALTAKDQQLQEREYQAALMEDLKGDYQRERARCDAAETALADARQQRDEATDWNARAHRVLNDLNVPNADDLPPDADPMYLWRRLEWLIKDRTEARQQIAALRQMAQTWHETDALDAALKALEHLSSQHIYLHNERGEVLSKDEFISAVCAALSASCAPQETEPVK